MYKYNQKIHVITFTKRRDGEEASGNEEREQREDRDREKRERDKVELR